MRQNFFPPILEAHLPRSLVTQQWVLVSAWGKSSVMTWLKVLWFPRHVMLVQLALLTRTFREGNYTRDACLIQARRRGTMSGVHFHIGFQRSDQTDARRDPGRNRYVRWKYGNIQVTISLDETQTQADKQKR